MQLFKLSSFVISYILVVNICAWTTDACHLATNDEKNRMDTRSELLTSNEFSDGKQFERSGKGVPFISAGLYNPGTANAGRIYISTDTVKGRKNKRQQIMLMLHGKGGGKIFITAEPNDHQCTLQGPTADIIDIATWAYIHKL